ncbi:MAG: methyltransferase domain-containing protein [Alphaproteobacteria bacterium]|nr:methyltransferase domain-containing protein [Alphaproteobacteria bacterium]
MDMKFQRRIQRYGWDKAATSYEAGWRDSLALVQSRLLDIASAQPGERALDVACGTGLVTFPLAQAVTPEGRVVATDISQGMIDMIQHEAAHRGVGQIQTLRSDAEALDDVPDEAFDLVTCALGLMYFPAPDLALKEALRVLKPGGRIVVAVWGARRNCGWAEIFPIVDARVQSAVCPLFFMLGTGRMLAMELERAGFESVLDERLTTTLPYPDETTALDAAFVGGPVALAYGRFSEETRMEARCEYLASISPYQSGNGYRIPGEFVIASARKPWEPHDSK